MDQRPRNLVAIGIICLLVLSACESISVVNLPVMKVSRLNADPNHFEGKEILVRGYVVLTPEAHILYESKELNEKFRKQLDSRSLNFDPKTYNKYCLTLANPDLLFKYRPRFAGSILVIKGIFLGHYLDGETLDIGACPLATAIMIDEADFKKRYLSR